MNRNRQHAIYGLYLADRPDVILYAGSWRVATLDERLHQHRDGACRTTAKMAARGGVETTDLRMCVLAYWMSGIDASPENGVILDLQDRGECRWNGPYAWSTEDCRKAGRIGGRKLAEGGWHQSPEGQEAHSRAGHIGITKMSYDDRARGGRRMKENGWHETPEAHEAHVRGGRIGGRTTMDKMVPEQRLRFWRAGGRLRACSRWHSDRPKVDRLCAECARKSNRATE